jgi:chorismate synthase
LRKSGDSVGAKITVTANGVPAGWGEPVYDRLDAEIAYAMMSINAVKGVEIGAGFASVAQKGSEHGDEMTPQGFLSNHAGGVLGGISTGQEVIVNLAIKPTSSIRLPRRSVTSTASRCWSKRTVDTTPASASGRRRLPRPCSPWC